MNNGFPKHVINGIRYSAHHIQSTTWMVKKYSDNSNDASYVECLFTSNSKDELEVIKQAIRNGSWA